jgi:alkanesulfonate monooxygenase SsuD/methylene tetrahydromethanopterin reductase-like flavin-dependent oxidoreductase (luciferase family)
MAEDIERLGIDKDRLLIAVGAGVTDAPLTRMREALPELREALPGVRMILATMGPKVAAFGGAEWDGVFLNWMTPDYAVRARGWVEEGAREAGRETPTIYGYVRTAVGTDAEERLFKDESLYRGLHQGYRSHFDRQGAPEGTVGIAAENAGVAQQELSRYRALDTVVVRALASATFEDMSALAEASAPGV